MKRPAWFDAFCRIHERPWVYVAGFVVPVLVAALWFAVFGSDNIAPLGMYCAFILFNDATWRYRMAEIHREGEQRKRAIEERYNRHQRVLARAAIDPTYSRRLNEAMAVRGTAALDDFPLPGRN